MNQQRVLPVIVLSQFCCTSLWFAGNAVMSDLAKTFDVGANAVGHLTAAVQLGFIAGTLVFALLSIADRFSPSKVFLICAVMGAAFNAAMIMVNDRFFLLLILRVCTGFFLAGIYPVGMKIAADHFEKGLGKSLGFLVGALVLGTAFPHLLKSLTQSLPWKLIFATTSLFALLGGLLMWLFVPDGPFRKPKLSVDISAIPAIFKDRGLRSAAFGYFGHMWELYALWAFLPVMLATYKSLHPASTLNISITSFLVIGIGGVACIISGKISQFTGAKKTAFTALLLSSICCAVSPFAFLLPTDFLFMCFLLVWGMAVAADSPLLSTLVAQHAPVEVKGTALTITNCIGFSITIISIQLLNMLQSLVEPTKLFVVLALGPIAGLIALRQKTPVAKK